jgi:hypothetical protein
MSSYFRSLLAEILPGWAFWRSSRRPTKPLDGAPLGQGVEPSEARRLGDEVTRDEALGSGAKPMGDQPPADPDSLNRRL